MKFKSILLVIVLFTALLVKAQVPKGINYQGAARKADGTPIANQLIGIEISIYDSVTTRKNVYVETHSITTNSLGLYSTIIGKGTAIYNAFDSIEWGKGIMYIGVKIDPTGGANYTIRGQQQLMSVPYAIYAGNVKTGLDLQILKLSNDTLSLTKNGGSVILNKYLDNTDSQQLIKKGRNLQITNANAVQLNDDDSTNELQKLSISNDTISLSKSSTKIKLPNPLEAMEEAMGCVFLHRFCTGDGTITNPWKSSDKSAGIFEAIKHLTITKRIIYMKPGYYFTSGAIEVDFAKLLPNLSNANWKNAFSGYGIEFQGHNASFYINGGAPLTGGKPGLLFNWKGEHAFYWKFTGMQFYGVVDTALVQFGNSYDFPWNGCDFDIVGNNGYVPSNYLTKASRSSAIKICWPLESRLHLVGVSATGSGVVLETATFCTVSGAFSNTIIPNTNTLYDKSYGLNLINCQSNTFTAMDLEVAYNGIKLDQWSIQNTFSAIFVANCDSTGATFDNSTQATTGKNVVISIRSGPTIQAPSSVKVQKLFTPNSDATKVDILNYFDF